MLTVKPVKVLLRSPNWLGDAVMAFPFSFALKEVMPSCEVTVVVREGLKDLWEMNPCVNSIVPIKGHKFKELKVGYSLRKERFSYCFLLNRSYLSVFTAWLTGTKERIGFEPPVKAVYLTRRVKSYGFEHRIISYLRLIEVTFGTMPHVHFPAFNVEPQIEKEAERMLGEYRNPLLVGLNTGSNYGEAKCWPEENFARLAQRLLSEGITPVLLGTKREMEKNYRIRKKVSKGIIDLTGRTSLKQLVAILKRMAVLVSNDTGTMHLAVALGVPVVALFGPTDPKITGPWKGGIVLKGDLTCSPCFRRMCPKGVPLCMASIGVDEVYKAIGVLLDGERKAIGICLDI